MKPTRKGISPQLTATIIILVILAGGLGHYVATINANVSSLDSQVSSIQSVSSSLEQQIGSIRASTSTVTATLTTTATTTATTISTEVSTAFSTITSTVVSTITSTLTSTSNSTACTSCSSLTVSGSLSVPGGSGEGTLVFTVKNDANNPITELAFTMPTSVIASYSVVGVGYANLGTGVESIVSVANSAGATVPVSPSNPINPGETASGALTVSGPSGSGGLNSGSMYTFIVTATFQDGSSVVQSIDITAQL